MNSDVQYVAARRIRHAALPFAVIISLFVWIFFLDLNLENTQTNLENTQTKLERIWNWQNNNWGEGRLFNNIKDRLNILTDGLQRGGRKEYKNTLKSTEEYKINLDDLKKDEGTWSTNKNGGLITVHFNFGIYVKQESPNKDEVNDDLVRFASFIEAIMNEYKNHRKSKNTHNHIEYSNTMFKVLGMEDSVKKYFPELGVAWMYIASKRGTYAVWPGNDRLWKENSKKLYNPTERPWFKVATGQEEGSEKYGNKNFGLTYIYDDFNTEISSLRTYFWNLNLNDESYIIGIDFLPLAPKTLASTNLALPIFSDIYKWPFFALLSLVFALVVGFFYLLAILVECRNERWVKLAIYVLGGKHSIDGKVRQIFHKIPVALLTRMQPYSLTIESATALCEKFGIKKTHSVSLENNGVINLSAKSDRINEREEKRGYALRQILEKSINTEQNSTHRGIEFWGIVRQNATNITCPLCENGIEVYPRSKNLDALVELNIYADPEPQAKLLFPEPADFPRWPLDVIRTRPSLAGNASFNITKRFTYEELTETPTIELPFQIQKFHEVSDAVEIYEMLLSGKFSCRDNFTLTSHIFENSDVRAVCDLKYFQKLLKLGKEGALYKGNTIERHIVVDSENEFDEAIQWFKQEGFTKILPRYKGLIYLVDVSNLPQDSIQGFSGWDFALVDEDKSQLIVSSLHRDLLDKELEVVRGEVSWRKIDIDFFEYLYGLLGTSKRRTKIWPKALG